MNFFFYLLTVASISNSALAIRCYTGITFGYQTPVNSSSLVDCSFFGYQNAQACMKLTDYTTGSSVRFCNVLACSSLVQGRLTNTPCMNDTYANFQQYGYTYQQLQGINYIPNFGSSLSLCCCTGDSCNSAETSRINHLIPLFCIIIFYFSNKLF